MLQPAFIPGLELNRRFYWEVVCPLLERHFPGLPHAAARLGPGSDVLGFDTPMSMDHDWGPKLLLFLQEADKVQISAIHHLLAMELPPEFLGFSTAFTPSNDEGTAVMQFSTVRPLKHAVRITTMRDFIWKSLGWDTSKPLDAASWLSISSQALIEMTAGAVYRDETGELSSVRAHLAWYPHDVWLYLLGCGWQRIGQEDHLMPRAGYTGDELGSALIGARLVRDLMHLCFLMEKRYPPYPKWFGAAFHQLGCAAMLEPLLRQVLQAQDWQERQSALVQACSLVASLHNRLGITDFLSEEGRPFFDRPFQVIGGERFVDALLERIADPEVQAIARLGRIGGVDQFSDSTDLRSNAVWRSRLRGCFHG
jgi:hypothetical protein